jgi:hypothetical protein
VDFTLRGPGKGEVTIPEGSGASSDLTSVGRIGEMPRVKSPGTLYLVGGSA